MSLRRSIRGMGAEYRRGATVARPATVGGGAQHLSGRPGRPGARPRSPRATARSATVSTQPRRDMRVRMSRPARVTIETAVAMTAPDGLTLRADVYRPVGLGPVPVLLHRTPYGRHQAHYREMAEAIASAGYTVVVQDLRGRFDSEGEFLPMWMEGRRDGEDGARAVEWSQTLPGVVPRVGMYGVSYDASVQWETAALRPAGLRSIYPGGMVADSRSVWPGVFRVGRQLKWYLMLAADTRRRAGLPPPHTRADSDLLWHFEAGKWIWNVPFAAVPADRLGGLAAVLGTVARPAHGRLVRLRPDRAPSPRHRHRSRHRLARPLPRHGRAVHRGHRSHGGHAARRPPPPPRPRPDRARHRPSWWSGRGATATGARASSATWTSDPTRKRRSSTGRSTGSAGRSARRHRPPPTWCRVSGCS